MGQYQALNRLNSKINQSTISYFLRGRSDFLSRGIDLINTQQKIRQHRMLQCWLHGRNQAVCLFNPHMEHPPTPVWTQ